MKDVTGSIGALKNRNKKKLISERIRYTNTNWPQLKVNRRQIKPIPPKPETLSSRT